MTYGIPYMFYNINYYKSYITLYISALINFVMFLFGFFKLSEVSRLSGL
jgi:hypothetical protein